MGMNEWFHRTFYDERNYLSTLVFELINISKRCLWTWARVRIEDNSSWGCTYCGIRFRRVFWFEAWCKPPDNKSITYLEYVYLGTCKHALVTLATISIHINVDTVALQPCLTHLPWKKWPPFWQTTISNAFSWMKMMEFRFEFHWNLFPEVQLTISQHWFR